MMYITNPEKAYAYLKTIWPTGMDHREKVMIVYLNRHYQATGHEVIFMGGIDSCTMDTRIVFQYAMLGQAYMILLAHNHPSGSTQPSQSDIAVTDSLVRGGQVLGIKVAHMIITRNDYQVLAFFE